MNCANSSCFYLVSLWFLSGRAIQVSPMSKKIAFSLLNGAKYHHFEQFCASSSKKMPIILLNGPGMEGRCQPWRIFA